MLVDRSYYSAFRAGDIVEMVRVNEKNKTTIAVNYVSGRGVGSDIRRSKGFDWWVALADVEPVFPDGPPAPTLLRGEAPVSASLSTFDLLASLPKGEV